MSEPKGCVQLMVIIWYKDNPIIEKLTGYGQEEEFCLKKQSNLLCPTLTRTWHLLHLHSDFWYNSLDSICTYHYLFIGINMAQSASSSKLNFWFIGSPTVLHWNGLSSIWSAIEVNEPLTENLIGKISSRSSPTSLSRRQSSKSSRYFVILSTENYIIIVAFFILGTLAQVGALGFEFCLDYSIYNCFTIVNL